MVIRLKSGRLQVRAAQPGKLTRACEQAFLLALSACANVRLAAAAVGAAPADMAPVGTRAISPCRFSSNRLA